MVIFCHTWDSLIYIRLPGEAKAKATTASAHSYSLCGSEPIAPPRRECYEYKSAGVRPM